MENNLDLTFLRQLMGGDEAMARRFLELFKTEMPKQLAALEGQLDAGDFAQANVTAHAVKGQLLTMGLQELADLALEIENKTEQEKTTANSAQVFLQLKTKLTALLANI